MQIVSPESVGFSSARLNNINLKMQEYVDNKNAPGFATLVARKGQVVHFETCGDRDTEHELPVEKDTIFRLYSLTKPVTSVALMQLYEKGKLQLYDPVAKYIPAFKNTKVFEKMGQLGIVTVDQTTPMTIHHLLTHTAGLSYGFFHDNPIDELYRQNGILRSNRSLEEFIETIADIPLAFQPGTQWRYSVATDVLGHLIAVLADMPFDDYLQEKIFTPLGMVDTSFHVPEDKVARLAKLYQHNYVDQSFHPFAGSPFVPLKDFTKSTQFPSGGGGLVSTITDYLQFATMLYNKGHMNGEQILGRKTIEFMTINHLAQHLLPCMIFNPILGKGWGLGFQVTMNPAEARVMSSTGTYEWVGISGTRFWVDPQEEIVCILMTQLMDNMLPIHDDFRVLTYQALID